MRKIRLKFSLKASKILLLPLAVMLQFCSSYEKHMVVKKFDSENSLVVVPWKDGNKNLSVVIDGQSNENYVIEINTYYLDPSKKKDKLTNTERIFIPAGKVKASFLRDYYGAKDVGKVEVRLEGPKSATCEVKVSLDIR